MFGCKSATANVSSLVARVDVVDQQPHPDATLGGPDQFGCQQAAGQVLVPDVVLHVQRALRGGGGRRAIGKCDGILLDEAQA